MTATCLLGLLGRIGDPRTLDPRDPAGYVRILPGRYHLWGNWDEFCGTNHLSIVSDWIEIEEAFWLSRYPVTNSQFEKFITDGGYSNKENRSRGGWAWLQEARVIEPAYFHDHRYRHLI